MPVSRIAFLAIAEPAVQDQAVVGFRNLVNECKKDGKPYLLSSKASKCRVVIDKPGSSAWTVCYTLTFASADDLKYYQTEDPVYQEILKRADSNNAQAIVSVLVDY